MYPLGFRTCSGVPFVATLWTNTYAHIEWGHGALKSTLAQALVCKILNILRCRRGGNPRVENITRTVSVSSMPAHMFDQFAKQNCVSTFPYRCPSVLFRNVLPYFSVLSFRAFSTPPHQCVHTLNHIFMSLADLNDSTSN